MRPGPTASFVAVLLTGVFAASADAGAHSLTASSQANQSSAQPLSSSFTIRAAADTTKPSSPVLSATPGDRQITLAWTAATDNVAVTRYEVWKDNAYVTGLSSSVRSYTATGLTNGASHSFRVVAYDAAGNYANSNTITAAATASDTTKPSAPVLSATPGDRQITLAWTAATDNVAVTRYEVWKDNAYVTSLSSSVRSYTATGLTNGASHSFRVVAYDAAGNYANSNTVSAAANG